MTISAAKTIGFCFGVDRAIKICEENFGKKNVFTYGPIVHNENIIQKLEKNGIMVTDDAENIPAGSTLIIRSHGIGEAEYESLANFGITVIDATCPLVKKVHEIVKNEFACGQKIVIIGKIGHPEVIGTNGWCGNSAEIIENYSDIDEEFAKKIRKTHPSGNVSAVSQTTFSADLCDKMLARLEKFFPDAHIFRTICKSTRDRQLEAENLSKKSDIIFVVGGEKSSNASELCKICKKHCSTVIGLPSAKQIVNYRKLINRESRVCVLCGASTEAAEVKEAVNLLEGMPTGDVAD
jgi:4-hydroxy-3-methylbut-2-enyl diphosphate reductase